MIISVLKKPQGKKYKLKPKMLFSKKASNDMKKGGIGKLIGRFSNRRKDDITASGEITEQKSTANESSRETEQKPATNETHQDKHQKPTPTKMSAVKTVDDDIVFEPAKSPGKKPSAMDIPEIPAFSANRRSEPERESKVAVSPSEKIPLDMNIPEIPAFNTKRSPKPEKENDGSTSDEKISLSMDIPEIPAFNAKENVKKDTDNDLAASISSDSSVSSYESYESA